MAPVTDWDLVCMACRRMTYNSRTTDKPQLFAVLSRDKTFRIRPFKDLTIDEEEEVVYVAPDWLLTYTGGS